MSMKPHKTWNKKRPLSWSAISSFHYDKEQWYRKYVLGLKEEPSREMEFGKKFSKSIEDGTPLIPIVTIYDRVEYPLKVTFSGIKLCGFIDTFSHKGKKIREYKTGKKEWDYARAMDHGQLKMYALCLYLQHKIKPEDLTIHLDWFPTCENENFEIQFVSPPRVHPFEVKLTMTDILKFGAFIKDTIKKMDEYCRNKKS